MAPLNEPLLDDLLGQLESARSWSPRVISKLETFIRTADDYSLFRVNPYQYTGERGITENEAIDLFLHSAKLGLFEMEWHMICASCGHVVDSLRNMNGLHAHFRCNLCSYENTATLDDYIQATFTLSPRIRELTFHHPTSLSAEEFLFKYNLSKGILPPPGFDSYEAMLRAATYFLSYIDPGEQFQVDIDVNPGLVVVNDLLNLTTLNFLISPTPAPEPQAVTAHWLDGKLRAVNRALHAQRVDFPTKTFSFDQAEELKAGPLILKFDNRTEKRGCVWVLHFPGEPPPEGLPFAPFLSGKKLITTQTFRNLFRTETVSADEGLAVKDITILFTDLKGSTALYDQIGDPKAYFLVRQHFDTLGNVINRYEGATIKTIGDAVMATFMTPLDGVRAALDMLRDIEAFNRNISDKLVLKIGIHAGHSIAVTLNDRLDYFGQTVNIAARVQGLADADEIYISEVIYQFPGVRQALAPYTVLQEQVAVKGVSEKLQVYKFSI